MTTIVTEFGKWRYNRLTIVIYASGGIFQDKLDEFLSDIDVVKTYIDDIICLNKDEFPKHMEQIRVISYRLCSSGLKCDVPKFCVGLNYILYLGYIITQ